MPRTITPEHKTAVLALLEANNGAVAQTALQTGFCERTLYRWKRQQALTLLAQQRHQSLPLPLPADDSQSEDDDELMYRYISQAALKIASELTDSVRSPDLLRRVSALNSLLDRLDLMSNESSDEPQKQIIQIEYVDAEGRIHAAPPWATDYDDYDGDEDDED